MASQRFALPGWSSFDGWGNAVSCRSQIQRSPVSTLGASPKAWEGWGGSSTRNGFSFLEIHLQPFASTKSTDAEAVPSIAEALISNA